MISSGVWISCEMVMGYRSLSMNVVWNPVMALKRGWVELSRLIRAQPVSDVMAVSKQTSRRHYSGRSKPLSCIMRVVIRDATASVVVIGHRLQPLFGVFDEYDG
jgi:hypothetical protein